MYNSELWRQRLLKTATAALAMILLGACSTPHNTTSDQIHSAISLPGATITHKFGTTTVPAHPQRVVTVGWTDQDFVLALGVIPVSTRSYFDHYNEYPWIRTATNGAGVSTWGGSSSLDFEAITANKPDLILAIYESIDKPTYDRLSTIAPTVIQSSDYADEETPWDIQLLTTGKALGKEAKAAELAEQVHNRINLIRQDNPEFAGKTLVVDFGPNTGGHYLLPEHDPRRSLFTALGFKTQDISGDISEERLDLIDHDILFINGATKEDMLASPAFSRLNVVRDDRTLYTSFDSPLSGALTYSGPYAMLYALDVLTPQLFNALNGRPVANLADA